MSNNINGIVMRPCSISEEGNESVMRSTKYWTEVDFYAKYQEHIVAMQLIAESAKIYILKNYKKITDWSEIDVQILDNTGNTTHYYKFKGDKGWNKKLKYVIKMLEDREKNQNPIVSFDDAVLDPTDGDFSVTINGRDHLWISDDSVIAIANFIEKNIDS
jgi:hypothetical protein